MGKVEPCTSPTTSPCGGHGAAATWRCASSMRWSMTLSSWQILGVERSGQVYRSGFVHWCPSFPWSRRFAWRTKHHLDDVTLNRGLGKVPYRPHTLTNQSTLQHISYIIYYIILSYINIILYIILPDVQQLFPPKRKELAFLKPRCLATPGAGRPSLQRMFGEGRVQRGLETLVWRDAARQGPGSFMFS